MSRWQPNAQVCLSAISQEFTQHSCYNATDESAKNPMKPKRAHKIGVLCARPVLSTVRLQAERSLTAAQGNNHSAGDDVNDVELMGVIWLKAELKVRMLNQRKLAVLCAFSPSEQATLSLIFHEKRAMSPGFAHRIATALRMKPDIVLQKFKLV